MNRKEIEAQSWSAYNQWCKQWREHCKTHSKMPMKPLTDFQNYGVGKAVLLCANGFSLEKNMETIKKYQHNVDILACDKTLGHLINHGITPTYVIVCDANVSYEKYLKPYEDKLQNTYLFINACGNPKWSHNGNWRDIYFFVNEDVINSHIEFGKLSGCPNLIPAATNVSNAMIVFMTQANNNGRNNFFGYDKILTIGFDFSWKAKGHGYYAFNHDGDGKRNYMRHLYTNDLAGDLAQTSHNLSFSARWLEKYIKTFKLPVVQCSKDTIFPGLHVGDLEEQMQYKHKPEDNGVVRDLLKKKNQLARKLQLINDEIYQIGRDHYNAYARSV